MNEKTWKAYSFRVQSGKIPVWIQNTATCQFSSGPKANISRLLLRTHKVSKDTCTMPKIENSKKATRIIWRILPVFYDVSNAIVKVFFNYLSKFLRKGSYCWELIFLAKKNCNQCVKMLKFLRKSFLSPFYIRIWQIFLHSASTTV